MVRHLVVALLLLGAGHAGAAGRQLPMLGFVQEVWDAKEGGLPHPGVTVLLQTRNGYLWVGTFTGLARFDGHDFVSYSDTPALSDHIRSLHEMPDGSLWVGTRRSGALRLRDGRVVETLTPKEGLPSKDVLRFASTTDGTLWMLAGGVVARGADGTVRRYGAEHGVPAGLQALLADKDGTIWLGGAKGALAWLDGGHFRTVTWESMPDGAAGRVSDLGRDETGALWAATGSAGPLTRCRSANAGCGPAAIVACTRAWERRRCGTTRSRRACSTTPCNACWRTRKGTSGSAPERAWRACGRGSCTRTRRKTACPPSLRSAQLT